MEETVDAEQRQFEPNPDFMEFLKNIDIEDINEEEQEQFVEEETTTAQELEDFMRKQSKIYDSGQIRLEDKKKLNKRINTLNLEQRKIFDEMMDLKEGKQFFLYLFGQAGTGKTYLLNMLIPALEFK